MSVLFLLLAIPLAVKLIWNLALPYAALVEWFRGRLEAGDKGDRGISLMPYVDVLGVLIASLGAFGNHNAEWALRPWGVVLVGLGLVVVSYLHLAIVGGFVGKVVGKKSHHPNDPRSAARAKENDEGSKDK